MTRTVLTVAAAAGAASAQSTFDDRGMFESGANDVGVVLDGFESFEGFPASDSDFTNEVDADGFTVTGEDLFDGFPFVLTIQDSVANGLAPTDGANYLSISSFDENVLTLTFDSAVNAVGLDLIDFGDFGGPATIVAQLDGGAEFTVFDGAAASGSTAFFGVVSETAFTTLTITNNFDGDQYGIDAVSFGVIPAPGAFAAVGLGGLAAARRRR